MWIVAIGWIYVVILMAATETSVIAGIMTFLIYCMIPLSLLFYLTGSKRRRARRAGAYDRIGQTREGAAAAPLAAAPVAAADPGCGAGGTTGCDGGGAG